ncbi:MAG: hypothetical protein EBR30_27130 [Cytophagia bacterium]|nr:hypothetical protein [Cytophagia bacterium]
MRNGIQTIKQQVGNYSLGWYNDSWQTGAPSSYYSGYGGIKFFTQAGPRMVIDYMGNVGIGTTTPEAKLQVAGNSILGNTYDTWTSFGASNGGRIRGSGEGYLVLASNPNGSGDRNMYYLAHPGYNHIMTGGKVGMGTYSPVANLDVYTDLNTPATFNTQSWTTGNAAYSLNLQTVWDSEGINQRIVQKFNGTDYTSLSFFKGNVGIGTTNPNQKLTVNGIIYGKEVKVDLQVPGPDYVFEPTYQLPSLTEIENYIKVNKHLPEVPSAKEMEANGINLSEMNMLLLKKVEELTLHLIEVQKNSIDQQKQLIDQRKEIEFLKSKVK